MSSDTVVLNDAVHLHMEIPKICLAIINTPHFQRLKNLKQLAVCHFVYPSASHNRYEHCIGVCYLAGEYGRILQKNQPDLRISEEDILCLQIAGLCHDLGHGPFSHTWEKFVKSIDSQYNHEDISVHLFDHMVQENNLAEKFAANKPSLNDNDLAFIKSLMIGKNGRSEVVGRGPEKDFLYEIVANKGTKIDVDKFDYLLRDCKFLNLTTAFDYRRVMQNSRVCEIVLDEEGRSRMGIVYEKKVAGDLEDLFRGRLHMHKVAYQHQKNKIVEQMLVDGFQLANENFIFLEVEYADDVKLSTAHKNLSCFIKLTDSIFEIILNNWVGEVDEAKALFKNIVKGEYYKCLGDITLSQSESPEAIQRKKENLAILNRQEFVEAGLVVLESCSGYGGKDFEMNPLNSVYFRDFKFGETTAERIEKHEFGPAPWEKKYYLVVKESSKVEDVKEKLLALKGEFDVAVISVRGSDLE